VEFLPQIARVGGLDVAFLGPTDLSNSLGIPGEMKHQKFEATCRQFIEALSGSTVAFGVMVPNADAARHWRARGARYIAVGLEAVLTPACRSYLKSACE
jgi:4-hydroxy-2-oxoheptanedioate aldolase